MRWKVGKSPPLQGPECHLAFGVRELQLHGRRRRFRAYTVQLDRAFRMSLLVTSAARRVARQGTTNICRASVKIQTLLKNSPQVVAGASCACGWRQSACPEFYNGAIGPSEPNPAEPLHVKHQPGVRVRRLSGAPGGRLETARRRAGQAPVCGRTVIVTSRGPGARGIGISVSVTSIGVVLPSMPVTFWSAAGL